MVIRQLKCVDSPRVVGAMVGQTLSIVNSDTLTHETHSITARDNTFKVTQPHSDMVFNYTLKTPEEMLRLGCEVHRWMVAYVGVEAAPVLQRDERDGQLHDPERSGRPASDPGLARAVWLGHEDGGCEARRDRDDGLRLHRSGASHRSYVPQNVT